MSVSVVGLERSSNIDLGKKNVLGILVNAVNYEAAVSTIMAAANAGKPLSVSALAVHGVMTGVLDSTHRYRINHIDLVLPDGQPVRWALNLLYNTELPDRVCGPNAMLKICERAAEEGLSIYLYGSQASVLEALSHNLCQRYPKLIIAGTQPSKFKQVSPQEKQEIAQKIRNSGAAITFVGLGCPRQEVWAYEYRDDLSMPLIAVGAAYDFHAGNLAKAPEFLSKIGLEWLFRMIKEPRRLWKRYVLLNPLYISLFLLQALKIKKFDPKDATPPAEEVLYG
ncbi:WecB/TagA/CpsF family glycosyltransferase [Tychonema sp. LEGE 07199]|uniref:WecB/TagA/CpsF family glycosyltransferase n=1 Tax=unclassified Tychonema TaxID=2642144 RepID=UPI00187E6AB7|nr:MULTISPECIES: WecB/TagA/CpsF family glycosyltransferase [unclassified Tychonema]MBE9120732.1 WecB/TagA/CpsF family glycosyltransferase [Tychonema sp. LEGE 07199]MBE9133388.1 WecB/TagA/CpsF family glycosyltransferase [Tychonema sp. LEGE 07196]